MKKIAILCSSGAWGGLEINIFNICRWLNESGIEIIVFTKENSKIDLELKKINITTIAYDQKGKKHFLFSHAKTIAKYLQLYQIHNLFIGHYEQHYTAVWCKALYINKLNLIYMQQMRHDVKKKNFFHSYFYRQINIWIPPLESLKNQLFENTILKPSQITTLPLCLETEKFYNNTISKAEAKKSINLSENDFLIGTIGRLDKEKGQEYLLKASHLLKSEIPNLKILFVGAETAGGTGYKQYLQSLARELNLESQTLFLDFAENPQNIFKALDIFIMSSISEPYGMVTLEALLSQTHVIGTKSGGTPDLLENGNFGQLFKPKNEKELSEAILNIYKGNYNIDNQKVSDIIKEKYDYKIWIQTVTNLLVK